MKNQIWAIVAALVVGLALQVGLSAAATGTTSGANAVSKSNVRIHLQGLLSGPQFAAFGGGRFTASGAITERGRFVDEYQGHHPPRESRIRTLYGAKGTLLIHVDRYGQWRVIRGTKAYAGLRGRGTEQGQYRHHVVDVTMIGTVSP